MSTLFRKNIFVSLAVLVFSLLISFYIVLTQNEEVLAQQSVEQRRVPPQFDFISQWNGGEVSGATATDIRGGTTVLFLRGQPLLLEDSEKHSSLTDPALTLKWETPRV